MGVIAVPNISEGRAAARIAAAIKAVESSGGRILDVHSDAVHNRSVFTVAPGAQGLSPSMVQLARSLAYIDLRKHKGVHPRLGGLDVCPVVPLLDAPMSEAVSAAHGIGEDIAAYTGLPVYFYGAAARRQETFHLPDLRRGGLQGLIERAEGGLLPDAGPRRIDPGRGAVCVGARTCLIAFNVWLDCTDVTAKLIASQVRTTGGGPPGVRALGMAMNGRFPSQVSMNLTDPETTGIDRAFAAVAKAADEARAGVGCTEVVGLVPQRYLPAPDGPAAGLLLEPLRPLESVLPGTSSS